MGTYWKPYSILLDIYSTLSTSRGLVVLPYRNSGNLPEESINITLPGCSSYCIIVWTWIIVFFSWLFIIDYASSLQVVNEEPADVHCPVVEMSTRSKLSCLSWNKFTKNHIASSDYEGIVTVWDVTTRQVLIKVLRSTFNTILLLMCYYHSLLTNMY